jgi:opacity protein-like surface antigen
LFCFACLATGLLVAPDASPQAYAGGGVGRSNATGPGGALFGSEDSANSYKIYGGYQFTRRWGFEAGYNDLGRLSADTSVFFFPASTTASFKLHNWYAAGTVNWTFGQLMILLKLGAVRNEASGVVVCNPACSPGRNEGRTQAFGAAGLEYPVWRKLAARLEFEYYGKATRDDPFGFGNSGAVTASGWSLSLKYAF